MTEPICSECIEAERQSGIDISRLLDKLAEIKGNKLNYSETIYLCLSLCGYSNSQIAYRLDKGKVPNLQELKLDKDIERKSRNMKSEMSARVNYYIKILMNIDRKPLWTKVILFLKANGYTKSQINIGTNLNKSERKIFMLCETNKSFTEISEILKKHGIYTLNGGEIV